MSIVIGAYGSVCQFVNSDYLLTSLKKTCHKVVSLIDHNIIAHAGYKDHEVESDDIISFDNRAVLVGKIFDRTSYKPIQSNNNILGQELTIDPKQLFNKFWGRYAGVLYDEKTQKMTIVRDPLGLSTIFYMIKPGGIIFSTELSFLYDLLQEKPSLNFDYFADYIINQNHTLPTTPFSDIKELQPGMALSMNYDGSIIQNQLWDMSSLKCSYISDKNAFEEELFALLKACTKAWMGPGDDKGVCVELSGGLDSSAVLLLARDILPKTKKLIAVNYIDSKVPSANEIQYAQEVARVCDTSLYFIDWQSCSLLDPLPQGWRPNKPSSFLTFYSVTKQLYTLAAEQDCPRVMSGQGGDHVFLAPAPKKALADLWIERGFRDFYPAMADLSGMYRMPLWELLTTTMKILGNYYTKISRKKSETHLFLDPRYVVKQHEFHLKSAVSHFYPAKAQQIEDLFHAVAYAGRNQRSELNVISHPLLSLPLVELALTIPTYQSFEKGSDRIFLRKAVSRLADVQAGWRKIKGETSGSMVGAWKKDADNIEDLILQGELVKSGLINKKWLQSEIARTKHGQINNLWPVIHILVSQRWLDQWGF